MQEVAAPDGRRWRVARRWTRRRVRWRTRRREDVVDSHWWDVFDVFDVFGLAGESPVLAVLAVVALLLVVVGLGFFVLVPLLLALVDLIVLLALLAAGGLARTAFRRPWEVEATTDGPPAEARSWRVRGWGESGRAVGQVARRLELGAADPSPDLVER